MKKKEESGFLQSRSLWLSFALGVFLFLEGEELEKVVSKYIPFGVQSPSSAQMAAPPQEKQELEEQEPVPIIYVDNRVELTQELDKIYKHVQENVQYPPEAKRRHIQGTVLVRFVLKKDGT
ncbi:energy transducer TonB, partial [Thermonema rossianum]|uniref:energy transducer TonB n=1 Tax=Thermonema rossianum TaxID=55505 RepID=UPI00056E60B1